MPAQSHYPHNFWQAFWHWVFIVKSDCPEPRTPSLPFLWGNSMFPALPFPEETSPETTIKTWTQIAHTVYCFQAGLMILQVWLTRDKCSRLVMIVSCRQRGRTSPDLPQYSFHCYCRAKSWARFAGPWPQGLSQNLLGGSEKVRIQICAYCWQPYIHLPAESWWASVHPWAKARCWQESHQLPQWLQQWLAVGNVGKPAHRWWLHLGTADLPLWAEPPAAPHDCCDTTSQNHLWTLPALRPRGTWSGETERRKGEVLSLDLVQSLLSVLDMAMSSTAAFPCTPAIQRCSSTGVLSRSPATGQAGSTICRLWHGRLAPHRDKLQGNPELPVPLHGH